MSVSACPGCSKPVSSTVKKCPQCGRPTALGVIHMIAWGVALLVLLYTCADTMSR